MAEVESLSKVFSSFEGREQDLIPVLQYVQEELGFLSEQSLLEIANFTGVPASRVFSVATFYSQFRFTPIGKHHVSVCRGTACHVRGAVKILDKLEKRLDIVEEETTADGLFSLETVACIGACGLAPTIVINKNTHGRLVPKDIDKIIDNILTEEKGAQDEN